MSRREFFALSLLSLLGARRALSMGADAEVGLAVLAHGRGNEARAAAVDQLMWEVSKRTSIDVRPQTSLVSALDPELFRWPFLVWAGAEACEPFSANEIARLSRFLRAGGTLLIDDASPTGSNGFDASVRAAASALFPERPLEQADSDHTIYRTFFLLNRPFGRIDRLPYLECVSFEDRSPLIYSRNDLLGAFSRDALGNWMGPVVPGGEEQREMAFRTGINLLMYATCLDYKRDQVHATAILRRRRWRVEHPLPTR